MKKWLSKLVGTVFVAGLVIMGAGRKNALAYTTSKITSGGQYGHLKYSLTTSCHYGGGSLYSLIGQAEQNTNYNNGQSIETSFSFTAFIPLIGGSTHTSTGTASNQVDATWESSSVSQSSVNFNATDRGTIRYVIGSPKYGWIDSTVAAN